MWKNKEATSSYDAWAVLCTEERRNIRVRFCKVSGLCMPEESSSSRVLASGSLVPNACFAYYSFYLFYILYYSEEYCLCKLKLTLRAPVETKLCPCSTKNFAVGLFSTLVAKIKGEKKFHRPYRSWNKFLTRFFSMFEKKKFFLPSRLISKVYGKQSFFKI